MPDIHSTAIVDPKAELADDVSVGPFSIIEGNVHIDSGTEIHSHVLVASGARIGKSCRVFKGAVLSTIPQDLKFAGEETTLEIGDNTTIREFADLNRGTSDRGTTVIGKNCLFMAYTHLAHDCLVGDHVIIANGVQVAGHVTIEDWVIVGGLTPIHQFTTIGRHAFIGGGYRVVQDVPPYVLAVGEPLSYHGLNTVGLRRRGFSSETRMALKRCYRLLYRSGLNTTQALERIKQDVEQLPEIKHVIQFVENKKRVLISG